MKGLKLYFTENMPENVAGLAGIEAKNAAFEQV